MIKCQMQARDEAEKAKADARNAVEEYLYETRNRLLDELAFSDDKVVSIVLDFECLLIRSQSRWPGLLPILLQNSEAIAAFTNAEGWLYDDEERSTNEYLEKLQELRAYEAMLIKGCAEETVQNMSRMSDVLASREYQQSEL